MPPIWKKIYEAELNRLNQDSWKDGDVFTTTQTLADSHSISYLTARRVLSELAKSGRVKNVPRVGCTVVKRQSSAPVYFLSPEHSEKAEMASSMMMCVKGIFEEALRRHLSLIPVTLDEFQALEVREPTPLIYLYGANYLSSETILGFLSPQVIPIGVNCPCAGSRGVAVGGDGHAAMSQLVRHMADLGCRRIAYVGSTDGYIFAHRRHGFMDTMRDLGLELNHHHVYNVDNVRGFEGVQEWLEALKPDAICASGTEVLEELASLVPEASLAHCRLGAIGMPHVPPFYAYVQRDFYAEGVKAIQLVSEMTLQEALKQPPVFHSVPQTFHPHSPEQN